MDESYTQILDTFSLRKIFAHLPWRDQLSARKVNKAWEREASFALGQNSRLRIQLKGPYQMIDFLLAFYAPASGPNRLLPLVNTMIAPVRIPTDRIQIFLQQHAEYIRTLTMIRYSWYEYQAAEKAKIILILNSCPNVEVLKFENRASLREGRGDPDIPTVGPLTQLSKVRHIDINCAVSQIGFLHKIIGNAPVLSSFSLSLEESYAVHPLTYTFFNKLKLLCMSRKMALELYLSNESGQVSLIDELVRAEFKPKELVVIVQPLRLREGDTTTECGRNLLMNLLTQMCQNGLEALEFRAKFENDTRIYLPDEMPWLKSLTFDAYNRCVVPNTKLTSGQVPNLEVVVTHSSGMILNEEDCYPKMRKLVIESGSVFSNPVEPLPSSATWPNQFPNLTILDIFVNPGEESFLHPILTQMLNMVDLTLRFKNKRVTSRPGQIWDMITGLMRPILDIDSPLDSIIPPDVGVTTQENGLDNRAQDLPTTVPALYNLRKLKYLKLESVPPCILVAIIHLTATHKLPRLSKLKMLNHYIGVDFDPAQEWVDVLEREHQNVDINFY